MTLFSSSSANAPITSTAQLLGELESTAKKLGLSCKPTVYRIALPSGEKTKLCLAEFSGAVEESHKSQVFAACKAIEKRANFPLPIVVRIDSSYSEYTTALGNLRAGATINYNFAEQPPVIIPRTYTRHEYHKDLTALPFLTIDPEGSVDLDDALAVRKVGKQLELLIAFADVTHLVRKKENDRLIHYASRFGCSLYDPRADNNLPMLGTHGEQQASLLPNVTRYAWVVALKLNFNKEPGIIQGQEIYRAKIRSHAKLNYATSEDQIENEAVRRNLSLLREVASKLERQRENAGSISQQKTSFANERLVSSLMVTAKHVLARFMADNNLNAFYRVHIPELRQKMPEWLEVMGRNNAPFQETDFQNRERLLRMIRKLTNHQDEELKAVGTDIFEHFIGKSSFSLDPGRHSGLNLEPFIDVKGLRKLDGLLNQLILENCIYGNRVDFDPADFKLYLNLLRSLRQKQPYFQSLFSAYNTFKAI